MTHDYGVVEFMVEEQDEHWVDLSLLPRELLSVQTHSFCQLWKSQIHLNFTTPT